MLSKLDDTLWHQIPTTFDHVGTSDPRFFDRYWFALYDPKGERAIQYTLAAYNNVDVMDGAVVVVDGDRQHNVRVSRTLRPRFETRCGPLSVDVVEPMQRLALNIDEGDHGISGAIEFNGVAPPAEEAPHFHRRDGRVVENYIRFNQIGRANGSIVVGGKTIEINDWWTCRDHSWGVRPDVGGIIEPRKAAAPIKARDRNFLFCFLFFSTDTMAGHVQMRADDHFGDYSTATFVDRKSGEPIPSDDFAVQASLVAGTKLFETVDFNFPRSDGPALQLTTRQIAKGIVMPGLGYSGGWNDRQGLGAWRGESYLEKDVWDISDPTGVKTAEGKVWHPLHRIYPVEVTASDGSTGTGSLTWLLTGDVPSIIKSS